jgi:ubiquitin C-terminal hydrolase
MMASQTQTQSKAQTQSKTQSKIDEQLLATPIVSNRSVPKDLTLESLDRFRLDSPASVLTERSNSNSSINGNINGSININGSGSYHHRQKRTFRFSCPDEEPIVVPRSRLTDRDGNTHTHGRDRGGLSRSKSPPYGEEREREQGRNGNKSRRRRRPLVPFSFSLLSSMTTLIATTATDNSNISKDASNSSKDNRDNTREGRLVVGGRTAQQLIHARDILSCWARDFYIEILLRLNGSGTTGAFWLLPNNIYRTLVINSSSSSSNINGNSKLLASKLKKPLLSAFQELELRWNRQKKRRNLSLKRRREQLVCVSGLPNQGQTCFLNSVLQSLASLEPFLEYLEGIVEYQEETEHLYLSSTLLEEANNNNNNNKTNTSLTGYGRLFFSNRAPKKPPSTSFSKELLDLLKGINRVEGGIMDEEDEDNDDVENENGHAIPTRGRRPRRRKRLNPKALLHNIAKTNPQFSSYGMYEQQDAQELFASLMGVVIHDSQLDASSSDRRLEATSCIGSSSSSCSSIGKRSENGAAQPKNYSLGHNISEESATTSGFYSESNQDDAPMTSAFAHSHSNHDRNDSVPRVRTQARIRTRKRCGDGVSATKLLGGNHIIATELAWNGGDEKKEDGNGDNGETNNILSLSGLLLRIGKERNRVQIESNRSILGLTTPNSCYDDRQDYQNSFPEEKKQEHNDAPTNTILTTTATTLVTEASTNYRDDRNGYGEPNRHDRGLLSPNTSRSGDDCSASGKRLMRSTMSPITPSPLSGWLGSTLRCSKCKHVRPIQNAPFLDIPLVPTSLPNYLSRAYQNSTTKPSSPNSSHLPSCSLETCLGNFTSVESVHDVECRSCTILEEIDRLEEEAMMLKGAVETTERRILNKTKGSKTNNSKGPDTRELESFEETKCLREDLSKVEKRLLELKVEDPDQDDDTDSSPEDIGDEFFFGAIDPRDKAPMQRCEARKCLLLTRTPSVLCCHIQRRYYDPFTGRMEKCVQFVEFPQFLDLSPYCAYGPKALTPWVAGSLPNANTNANITPTNLPKYQPSVSASQQALSQTFYSAKSHGSNNNGSNENIAYRLQSVIEHRGNAFGGHYVSYRRDHTGSWFCISDSLVTPVSWRQVQTCQAYMLFYEAI